MDKIIVYVDDAAHALQQLTPMLVGGERTEWIVVACPPHMTRHVSKWVSHSARQAWRTRWSDKLAEQIMPALRGRGDPATLHVAQGPLEGVTAGLLARHGAARVLDARRPKFGQDLPPVIEGQPTATDNRWTLPGSVAALGAVLVLGAE